MAVSLEDLLSEASSVLVCTGAGISTGSGIADYRGPQGVWQRRQPVYYQDFMSSEAARIEYWDYKLEGWQSFRDAKPNAVHQALVALEGAGKLGMLITQNVDGLHLKAGTSPERLIELHGSNLSVECQGCLQRSDPEAAYLFFKETGLPPRCAACDGFLKPATISFGQQLRQEDLQAATVAAEQADCVIALGTTLAVQPACSIPLLAARRGVPYVIINRGETEHDGLREVALRLEGDVVELFPPAVYRCIGEDKNL